MEATWFVTGQNSLLSTKQKHMYEYGPICFWRLESAFAFFFLVFLDYFDVLISKMNFKK